MDSFYNIVFSSVVFKVHYIYYYMFTVSFISDSLLTIVKYATSGQVWGHLAKLFVPKNVELYVCVKIMAAVVSDL